ECIIVAKRRRAHGRTMLGNRDVEAAWVDGPAMTLDQAVAYAVAESADRSRGPRVRATRLDDSRNDLNDVLALHSVDLIFWIEGKDPGERAFPGDRDEGGVG